jgi:hypothetical protein
MPRALPTLTPADLERQLLSKGVAQLAGVRDACADCQRTPLVGERVHRYEDGDLVCDLCRPRRRRPPERTELVRHAEHGGTVRRRRAA